MQMTTAHWFFLSPSVLPEAKPVYPSFWVTAPQEQTSEASHSDTLLQIGSLLCSRLLPLPFPSWPLLWTLFPLHPSSIAFLPSEASFLSLDGTADLLASLRLLGSPLLLWAIIICLLEQGFPQLFDLCSKKHTSCCNLGDIFKSQKTVLNL